MTSRPCYCRNQSPRGHLRGLFRAPSEGCPPGGMSGASSLDPGLTRRRHDVGTSCPRVTMVSTRYSALPLLLGLFAATACSDLTGIGTAGDFCFHSEGCSGYGKALPAPQRLTFSGLVTSSLTGQPLDSVTVRVDVPARGAAVASRTDSTGHYETVIALPSWGPDDCVGLAVRFIDRGGFLLLKVTDFPQLKCGEATYRLDASLTPLP